MDSASVQHKAEAVAALLESRLRIRGRGLAEKLRRGGRALPRQVRAEAAFLAEAAQQAGHPRLLAMLDHDRVDQAYRTCHRHLDRIGAGDRMVALLLGMAGSAALAVLVVGALFVAVLVWRGLV